ncbi:hypothetical protein [Jidongwangia harbinensis]|uniref:hypothetical protein n=1 Tax=Jidongwangia harbinensis TaxID=2878561 RepID=UPI001CD9FE97|nr:hypothetical protein [Jidongwangia harbinensis]MCA2211576.1 hypothetical protein [Jidongwangia harbinensis]
MARRRPCDRLVSALLGIVALLGLAGCSPDPHPYIALAMVDGRPTVLVAACARGELSYVTLAEREDTTSPAPSDVRHRPREWSVGAPLSAPGPDGVRSPVATAPARIALFERPSDWLISRETLREFRDGAEYRVYGGPANVATLEFTVARLRELAPGTVLTGVGYRDQHVVSEPTFEKAAEKDCDRS